MRFKPVIFFILLAAALLLPLPGAVAAEAELAANPGFEEGEGPDAYFWKSDSWEDKGEFRWDASQKHTGQKSVCIINDRPTDSRYKQKLTVKPDTCYRLSCWIRTENAGSGTKGANISVEGLSHTSRDIKGTSVDWEYVELYGITGKSQTEITLTLGLGGYSSLNSGKAWFDDVSVVELKAAPEYENVIKLYLEEPGEKTDAGGGKGSLLIFFAVLASIAYFACRLIGRNVRKPAGATGISSAPRTGHSSGSASATRTSLVSRLAAAFGSIPASGAARIRLKPDKKDYIIMSLMTAVYLIPALANLGSVKAPETSWTPAKPGESVIVDLGREASPARIYSYGGLGYERPDEGRYRIQYEDSRGGYMPLATIEKKDGDVFVWRAVNTPDVKARRLKILVDGAGGTINELAVFEKGSTAPLKGLKIVDKAVEPTDQGRPENLFDEQGTVDFKHSYLSGMIFDEIYHAKTAYEYLKHMEPGEWTHPPLGKIFISIGIALFGMDPFGWRIIGTLFGAGMVPAMYLFGRKLFGGRFYAFCAAFLMMFDFLHFGLTRIATIDVYATFFIILMYYFMYDCFVNKSYEAGFRQSLRPLFLCGLMFGLGAASKWIGLYAGGGLALLFFLAKYQEYRDYRRASAKKGKKPLWTADFIPLHLNRTVLYCILFFVIIPGFIYALSYIPYMLAPGHGPEVILNNQAAMFKFHSHDVLGATHPFSSYWWEWPLIRRPLETYSGSGLAAGMSSSMTLMGNPAIWWAGIFAVIAAAAVSAVRRDRKMLPVFIAIVFQYLPWIGVTRVVFIYHFFSTVPFMILAIVYVIKALLEKYPAARYPVFAYLALVLALFVMFYPVLSGMEVRREYVEQYLLWFKGRWVF